MGMPHVALPLAELNPQDTLCHSLPFACGDAIHRVSTVHVDVVMGGVR